MISIAIDGPAGAGKSTIAKLLSERLHINYMDTGAMYRAVAYELIRRGIEIADHESVRAALPQIECTVRYTEGGEQRTFINGEDVTPFIRSAEVTKGSSDVAVIPEVRVMLAGAQRETAKRFSIVMDGRDIGTYVLPDADVKLYVTASSRERARRRKADFDAAGISRTLDELEQDIIARDKTDSSRDFAPLRQAEDAHYIDTTEMDIEAVQELALAIIAKEIPDVL